VPYLERSAPLELAGLVTRLWFLEMPPPRRHEKILPLPYVHVIVNLSEPYRLFDRTGTPQVVERAFVSGIQQEYLIISNPPLLRHVCAELSPPAVRALSGMVPAALTGRVLDAEQVFPGLHAAVAHRGATAESALDALTSYLTNARRPAGVDPLVQRALETIQHDPLAHMGRFAATEGVSHKTLIARFTATCGLTPKAYAQVWRFSQFVGALPIGGFQPNWADLAAASSYYDQPQVIRAFRRFSGYTPSEYRQRVSEFGPQAASFVPLDEVPAGEFRTSRTSGPRPILEP
jgi:AraC-like DNA-binding protein